MKITHPKVGEKRTTKGLTPELEASAIKHMVDKGVTLINTEAVISLL